MSKIALSPDAAGTGTFTLASPNSNTNRTITLPDGDVTLGAATPSITDNGNATAITIDANENVGIGTTGSPSQKLHVEGAGNQFILLNNSTTNDGFYFKAGAGASSIQTNAGSHVMNFFTSGSEAMRIKSSGAVTMPKQPSFHAVMSGNQTGYNAASTGDHTLVYNAEAYDIGSNFNTSTGRFTAPVDGTYQFVATAYCNPVTAITQAWFVVGTGRAEGTDIVYQNAATDFPYQACTIKLDAGDVIGWHPYVAGGSNVTILANNNHTWFKGTLLH